MLVSKLENTNKAMCCAFVGDRGVVVGREDGKLVECQLSRDNGLTFSVGDWVNHQTPVTCVVGSGQGDGVLSSDKGGNIHFHRQPETFTKLPQARIVNSVCFLNGEQYVLSAQQRGVVAKSHLETNTTIILPTTHKLSESVSDVVCLDNGLIASTSTDCSARVFDLNSNSTTHVYMLENYGRSLARGEGQYDLVVGSRSGTIRVFDYRMGLEPKLQVKAHKYGIGAISSRGGVLATCSSDRTCKVWKWTNGELNLQYVFHEFDGGVSDVHLSKDHSQLLVSAYDCTVRLYDLAYGDRLLARTVIEQAKLVPDLEPLITRFLW
ncbi:hypothetical protein BASA81_002446 [Batrachochytrium salamandrivorans]|nr:hypothetical protein BASA81_002446 [Batrachochytrium salamandrivorans]